MTTRAKLQEKSLDELRTIAAAIDVPDHENLQKSKLIAAILDSDRFEVSAEPAPVEVPDIVPRRAAESDGGDDDPQPRSNQIGGGGGGSRGGGGRDYEDRGNRRRNRRGGRSGGQGGGGGMQGGGGGQDREPSEEKQWDESDLEDREGILDVLPEGYGFLRCTGYLPGDKDVYVSATQVRKFGLRRGDILTGPIRPPRSQEKFPALTRIDTVSGMTVEEARRRPKFGDLTPLFPDERLPLEVPGQPNHVLARIIDLIAPIGKGQRGLIVSPPKAGKTTVLKEIANSITSNNPECHLIVVLVDERPEEVTDMQRSVKG